MAKTCPYTNKKVLYTECIECENKKACRKAEKSKEKNTKK